MATPRNPGVTHVEKKNGLPEGKPLINLVAGQDLNLRPSGYEPVSAPLEGRSS